MNPLHPLSGTRTFHEANKQSETQSTSGRGPFKLVPANQQDVGFLWTLTGSGVWLVIWIRLAWLVTDEFQSPQSGFDFQPPDRLSSHPNAPGVESLVAWPKKHKSTKKKLMEEYD